MFFVSVIAVSSWGGDWNAHTAAGPVVLSGSAPDGCSLATAQSPGCGEQCASPEAVARPRGLPCYKSSCGRSISGTEQILMKSPAKTGAMQGWQLLNQPLVQSCACRDSSRSHQLRLQLCVLPSALKDRGAKGCGAWTVWWWGL